MKDPEEQAAARALELLGGHVEEEGTNEEELTQTRVEFNEGLANLVPSSEETAAEVEEAQPEAEQEEVELPDLDPKLPEDLAEELDMPEWDEDDSPPQAEVEEDDEEYDDDDPQVQALKARLKKAERKAQWAEQQRMEARKGKWQEEAKKYFPLSEYALSDISATSRRGFLREARAAHDAIKPVAMEIAKRYAEAHGAAKQAAIEEGKEHAKEAWGKPTVAPGGRETTTQAEREEKLKTAKNLEERIKTRIWG